MKTEWDYTALADAYLNRPDYSADALQEIFKIAALKPGDKVCDIGAGVAHLTLPLAKYGCVVDAVEPNDAMAGNGKKRTADLSEVHWYEGTGEDTGRPSGEYDFVAFGSSFNVCDRSRALQETWRLLKPGKWFACLWNHRDLNDPVQKEIENIIAEEIPGYSYGTRREDQKNVIEASGLFDDVRVVDGKIIWEQTVEDVVTAWKSHATLQRQAGEKFEAIVSQIEKYLNSLNVKSIEVPYTTRAWVARRRG